MSYEADADGEHGALRIEVGAEGAVARPAFARPADGAVVDAAGAPTARWLGAALDAWDPMGR